MKLAESESGTKGHICRHRRFRILVARPLPLCNFSQRGHFLDRGVLAGCSWAQAYAARDYMELGP